MRKCSAPGGQGGVRAAYGRLQFCMGVCFVAVKGAAPFLRRWMVFSHVKRCPWAFLPLSLMFFFFTQRKTKVSGKKHKNPGEKKRVGEWKDILFRAPLLPSRACRGGLSSTLHIVFTLSSHYASVFPPQQRRLPLWNVWARGFCSSLSVPHSCYTRKE